MVKPQPGRSDYLHTLLGHPTAWFGLDTVSNLGVAKFDPTHII